MEISVEMPQAPKPHPAKMSVPQRAALLLAAFALALLVYGWVTGQHAGPHVEAAGHHATPALWSIIPFVGLLLSIAILPLIPATAHWWESNRNRLGLAVAFAAVGWHATP